MRHLSTFSGMGGFDLAAQWIGWQNVAHVEINPFLRRILKYYWPNALSYDDIKTTDFTIFRGLIDVLSGGFPCQPYSTAGKRRGKQDDRHLWPEMLRAIREIQPRWVVGENVRGLTNWNGGMVFDEVQANLEYEGYEVLPFLLPAAGVNAPHRRDRIWFIAFKNTHVGNDGGTATSWKQDLDRNLSAAGSILSPFVTDTEGSGRQWIGQGVQAKDGETESGTHGELVRRSEGLRLQESPTDSDEQGQQGNTRGKQRVIREEEVQVKRREFTGTFTEIAGWKEFPTQSPVCDGDDGLPARLDSAAVFGSIKPRQPTRAYGKWRNESIKAAGNAVVPQVVVKIFKAIQQYEDNHRSL